MNKTVAAIAQSYRAKIEDNQIFFAPDIPDDKLQQALDSYARSASKEDVLVLVDDTVWGGARDGLLLTAETLYGHAFHDQPQSIDLGDIDSVTYVEGWPTNRLYTNESEFGAVSLSEKPQILLFIAMIKEMVATIRMNQGTPEPASPVQALRQLKQLFEEGLITEGEFESKKKQHLDEL